MNENIVLPNEQMQNVLPNEQRKETFPNEEKGKAAIMNEPNEKTLLRAEHVTKHFPSMNRKTGQRVFVAVDDVSLHIDRGETMGLLGESGSGKSTLARMIMGLTTVTEGKILYDGNEISAMKPKEYWPFRRRIQLIFQNPFASLDPRMSVRNILLEPLRIWGIGETMADKLERVRDMLQECGLPTDCLDKRPGEFSGGQLQRISIARALLIEPEFLIADEIVSALDVPVQNQILTLLCRMKEQHGLTMLFITHDLAVVRKISDRVLVMKNSKLLDMGPTDHVLDHTEDPYIRNLTEAAFPFHV